MGNLLQIVFLPVPVPERIAQDVPDTHLWPGDEQEIKSTFPFYPVCAFYPTSTNP
jgi:hypothetical protein